jgi:hypothetical protein
MGALYRYALPKALVVNTARCAVLFQQKIRNVYKKSNLLFRVVLDNFPCQYKSHKNKKFLSIPRTMLIAYTW